MLQSDHIWVAELFHDLQLTIFISFVLVNLLDCNYFTSLCSCCLSNNYQMSLPLSYLDIGLT